jgi:hypothetical protein
MTSMGDLDYMIDRHAEEETPPFALSERPSRPQHPRGSQAGHPESRQSPSNSAYNMESMKLRGDESQHQTPLTSSPPDLVESMMTDGSCSVQSDGSDSIDFMKSAFHKPAVPGLSTFLMSSLKTVHSDGGDSAYLPATCMTASYSPLTPTSRAQQPDDAASASVGFSQLMQAAGDTSRSHHHQLRLGRSLTRKLGQSSRMPSVPERGEMGETLSPSSLPTPCADEHSGTLISSPEALTTATRRWFSNQRALTLSTLGDGMQTPLLSTADATPTPISRRPVTHLLSNQLSPYSPLDKAKTTIQAIIDDDQAFEVNMVLDDPSCTVQDVMRIIGDPDLLNLWCDPIETLIVTSTSDGDRARRNNSSIVRQGDEPTEREPALDREYEGEWVEATTTALGSPPSTFGFVYRIGQFILESVGCASYGRVTMFVERRRGRVGLTVGPFHGGILASHTITASKDDSVGGLVRVVDRVRLTHDDEDVSLASFFCCGAFESCLSRSVLPSVSGYLDQVTTSMARLRLLVECNGISGENSIVVVDAMRRRENWW